MTKFNIKKINMSSKDRSLILFFIASLIVIWSTLSAISFVIDASKQSNLVINKIAKVDKNNWINLLNPIQKKDLKNKIIILNFWNYSCIPCIQNISKLRNLKLKYGNKILIIGIHTKFFGHNNKLDPIKKAVLRNNINFPVFADIEGSLLSEFAVKSTPTYILIDPLGKIKRKYENIEEFNDLPKDIESLIGKFRYRLNKNSIALILEKDLPVKAILKSPNRLAYTNNFTIGAEKKPAIFLSDGFKHNILVISTSGEILYKIGGKKSGFEDGDFDSALFNNPQGMVFESDKLYVADSGNNSIRVVDFNSRLVKTIIGNGEAGKIFKNSITPVANSKLNSPTDIEFFPDNNNLIIANSGTNQILIYNFGDRSLKSIAGNGKLGLKDGVGKDSELAQTVDLYSFKDELFFIDSKSSSLRKIDTKGNVKTLIGKGVGIFGYQNGSINEALMQNPTSLTADDTGIYIVDSFNSAIRRYDFESKKISDYESSSNTNNLKFDEPSSIISMLDLFYVSDTNNSRVISIQRANYKRVLFDIIPQQRLKKGNLIKFTINKTIIKDAILSPSKEIEVKIDFGNGWKINNLAPSYLNLLMMESDSQAKLVKLYDWQDLKNKNIKLPELQKDKKYFLQGFIYFCEDKEGSLCYVKEVQRNLIIESKKHDNIIEIKIDKPKSGN